MYKYVYITWDYQLANVLENYNI